MGFEFSTIFEDFFQKFNFLAKPIKSFQNAIRTLGIGQKSFIMVAKIDQKIYFVNFLNFSYIWGFSTPLDHCALWEVQTNEAAAPRLFILIQILAI